MIVVWQLRVRDFSSRLHQLMSVNLRRY